GDRIERNDPLVEVETTKSALELPSPQSGVVRTLHAAAGEKVAVGDPLVTFEVPDAEAGIVGTIPVEQAPTRRVRLSAPPEGCARGGPYSRRRRRHAAERAGSRRAGAPRGPRRARLRLQRRRELGDRRLGTPAHRCRVPH